MRTMTQFPVRHVGRGCTSDGSLLHGVTAKQLEKGVGGEGVKAWEVDLQGEMCKQDIFMWTIYLVIQSDLIGGGLKTDYSCGGDDV